MSSSCERCRLGPHSAIEWRWKILNNDKDAARRSAHAHAHALQPAASASRSPSFPHARQRAQRIAFTATFNPGLIRPVDNRRTQLTIGSFRLSEHSKKNVSEHSQIAGASWPAMAAAALLCAATPAHALTATFSSSQPTSNAQIQSLSKTQDAAGPFLGLGQWIGLLFAQPFATTRGETVSVFTLAPPNGAAQFTVSIGRYNNGAPVFVSTRNIAAGSTLTVTNLFQAGCSVFGGCDFIEITTRTANRGATGASVDYVSVNGEPVIAASPTPEPSTWTMMLVGFLLVGLRAKAIKRSVARRPIFARIGRAQEAL
jgi:hypothetical protein